MKYPEAEINIQGEDQILNRRKLKKILWKQEEREFVYPPKIDTLPHTFVSDDGNLKEEKRMYASF